MTQAAPTTAMKHLTLALLLLGSLGFAAGCSGDTNDPTGSGGSGGAGGTGGGSSNEDSGRQDGFVTCADPGDPLDTYLPNMSKAGANSVLTFTLLQSDNAPPIRDRNIWKLKMLKADQTRVMGDVVPEVKMPRHEHPAGLQPKVTFDANEGVYVAEPVYFFMAGYWMAKFTVFQGPSTDAEVVDSGAFYFCVD